MTSSWLFINDPACYTEQQGLKKAKYCTHSKREETQSSILDIDYQQSKTITITALVKAL